MKSNQSPEEPRAFPEPPREQMLSFIQVLQLLCVAIADKGQRLQWPLAVKRRSTAEETTAGCNITQVKDSEKWETEAASLVILCLALPAGECACQQASRLPSLSPGLGAGDSAVHTIWSQSQELEKSFSDKKFHLYLLQCTRSSQYMGIMMVMVVVVVIVMVVVVVGVVVMVVIEMVVV
ncbi:Dna Helicase Mcm9 [Manis pentadactyla]|nr:Dna Helicase Mcm9 [Manis pentadactyla]